MIFNSEVLKKIEDQDMRIDNIFCMDLLTVTDSLPKSFLNIFMKNPLTILIALKLTHKDLSGYDDLKSEDDLIEFLYDHPKSGYLIEVSTPVMIVHELFEDGEPAHIEMDWASTISMFAYAETLDDALLKALEYKHRYYKSVVDSANAKKHPVQ